MSLIRNIILKQIYTTLVDAATRCNHWPAGAVQCSL